MHSFFFSERLRRQYPWIVLCAVWTAGFLLSILLIPAVGQDHLSLMQSVLRGPVSAVGLLCAVGLPFLLTVWASVYHKNGFLYLLGFAHVFLYSFSGLLLCGSFGSSGWLIQRFIQFPQCMMLPVYFWFLLRRLQGYRPELRRDCVIFLLISLAVVSLYLCAILPFWNTLIEHYK